MVEKGKEKRVSDVVGGRGWRMFLEEVQDAAELGGSAVKRMK